MSEERAEYRARPRELRYTPMPPAVAGKKSLWVWVYPPSGEGAGT